MTDRRAFNPSAIAFAPIVLLLIATWSAADEVVLHFPPDRWMGSVYVMSDDVLAGISFTERINAQGDVRVPRGKRSMTYLSPKAGDLSVIREMPKLGLYALVVPDELLTESNLNELASMVGIGKLALGLNGATDDMLNRLAELRSLESLTVGGQNITVRGLEELARLPALSELRISPANLVDEDLGTLAQFKSLKILGLTNDSRTTQKIGDAGLARLQDLWQLETLELEGASITDAGMVYLAGLTNLTNLNLTRTKITDAGLAHVAGLKKLKLLAIERTQVTPAGLVHLAGLTDLEELRFSLELIDDELEQIGKLTALKKLVLNGFTQTPQITDLGLEHLTNLRHLEYLDLASPHITDRGMESIAKLTGLKTLWLRQGDITGTGLEKLAALRNLQQLNFNRMPIGGDALRHLQSFPGLESVGIFNLVDIHALDLSELEKVKGLKNLSLSCRTDENLREEELANLARLDQLRVLILDHTAIDDAGAKQLSQLHSLQMLHFDADARLTDEGLGYLAEMPGLLSLRVGGEFSAAGLQKLAAVKTLRNLMLFTSAVDEDAVKKLQSHFYVSTVLRQRREKPAPPAQPAN